MGKSFVLSPESKVTGTSLEARRAVMRQLADQARIVVWEARPDGTCVYVSSAIAGRLAKSLDLSHWYACIHPDDSKRVAECVNDACREGMEYQVEYRILRSDGTVRWMSETAAPKLTAQGKIDVFVGTFVDVSDSHETRVRLAHSEMEHRLLTENACDMISHSDANDVYVYASPSHKDTLGYDPQELIGTPLYAYIHPDDLAGDTARRPGKAGGKRRGLVNIRFRHKDGSWVWIAASTRTLRDPQTGAKLGMVSVAREITAQMEAERELARREERFRSLTSLSSDWYWETDPQLRFTFFSEGIYNKLRVRPEQLLGSHFEDHAHDSHAPGLLVCLESIRARRPFHDVIFPAASDTEPEIVRFLRISGEPFSENGQFCGYRGVSRDVTREVRTAKALERLATRDILTELPNRALLQTQLRQRLEQRESDVSHAVFFIDLDDFKEVNDSLGHAAGDLLLKEIAVRLNQCVRPDDTVARLGGDEFVVVAECPRADASAARLAEKLCKALDQPMLIEGHEVKASASIGISMHPQDGNTSESLLQSADTALYRAKALGGNTFCFFTAEMGEASRSRMLMQSALRHAIARNELQVYYQPRVHLKTFEVTGVEALLRWASPELGPVSPSEFIPLAEEIGLIDEIGDWVLRQATMQAQQWNVLFDKPLKISVNLSARQIRTRKLLASVAAALQDSGLPAQQLELELTESALMEDADVAAELLAALKALGLRLSVDDFGTGYSSLAYLCRFPLDSLKLDRSFLLQVQPDDIGRWKLAEAVINLAHTLGLSVVAEGVESAEHLAFLRTTSCDEIQGTCISEPLPRHLAEKLLQGVFASGSLSGISGTTR
ncbi:EAL and GGDEF domain-containing protein [Noviherbaspirillum saxi]|nr:bifunctional diguanylate cyclase/phosphodiesterase [Noviherbaspirillum saxi]